MAERRNGESGDQGRDFEVGLERLFGQAPGLADAETFAGRVESRLDRSWRVRTLGLGAAGVVGGVIAASQALGSGVGLRLEHATTASAHRVDSLYHQGFVQAQAFLQASPGLSLFWVASGLLILAAVVGATRAFDEF